MDTIDFYVNDNRFEGKTEWTAYGLVVILEQSLNICLSRTRSEKEINRLNEQLKTVQNLQKQNPVISLFEFDKTNLIKLSKELKRYSVEYLFVNAGNNQYYLLYDKEIDYRVARAVAKIQYEKFLL